MAATRKKSTKKTKSDSSRFKTGIKILCLLLAILVVAVLVTERKQWPENMRNHAAVKRIYSLRDDTLAAIKPADDKDGADSRPITVTAPKTQKAEPGYTEKERDSLESLMRAEGVTP